MLYNDLPGSRISGGNFRLRFMLIFFGGLVAFSSILYWRSQLLFSQEYVDFPQYKVYHHPKLTEKELLDEQN